MVLSGKPALPVYNIPSHVVDTKSKKPLLAEQMLKASVTENEGIDDERGVPPETFILNGIADFITVRRGIYYLSLIAAVHCLAGGFVS